WDRSWARSPRGQPLGFRRSPSQRRVPVTQLIVDLGGRAVVLVSQSEICRQVATHFPIVVHEQRPLQAPQSHHVGGRQSGARVHLACLLQRVVIREIQKRGKAE